MSYITIFDDNKEIMMKRLESAFGELKGVKQ
jgi:hypothetical protein